MARQKTYWHLLPLKRMPSEYELLSSRLLYYPGRGFEVEMPSSAWYARYQEGSPLKSADWERFADPRETTYAKYAALQSDKEIYVDGLLASSSAARQDERLPGSWLDALARLLGPLRYPCHGLQMAASYVGSMAPSGRIVLAALFQSADELRRVQRLAYRTRQLQDLRPGFARDARELWQKEALWQALREAVEKLLIAYDWGEAFVALNLVLKPAFDELFMVMLAREARKQGDVLLAQLLQALEEDCRWHREWSRALARAAITSDERNARVIARWIEKWRPAALGAAAPFADLLGQKMEPIEKNIEESLASCKTAKAKQAA